jgi:hypothetical protein
MEAVRGKSAQQIENYFNPADRNGKTEHITIWTAT